ncbi:AAA family ATPase [Candidatus Woesearchaeota archaeon]|nr:MAG: AAA family ATPase [Candidatus Woesearchaeota archaeon]
MKKEIQLKVAEAIQDDVNKGIVRISSEFMQEIGVTPGDVVEIEGGRKTVALTDRAYPGDLGLNLIRMDGILRRNAKTGIGEIIKVRKTEIKEAKKIIIAPASKGVVVRASPHMFKQGLLGRPVVKGDVVSLGGSMRRRTTMSSNPLVDDIFKLLDEEMIGLGFGDLKFVIVSVDPKGPVIISENTEIVFNPEAVDIIEETERPEVNYEDVGGLDEEIRKIREMVELPLKHPEVFERLGIDAPKGVLLHGPPGTGKTLLAKAVANETNSNFLVINGPEIMSKYYGQSEENLRKKFEDAEKNAPSIIFIDEIDAIAPKREESKGEVEKRVVAQLLAIMDGLKSRGKVVVIAATNMPNELDPALRRPGRFDREIEIGVPDKKGRLNILKIHTRNMPLAKDVNLKEIADITHGFVGADLASVAREAAMILLRRLMPELKLHEEEAIGRELLEKLNITQKDFMDALKVVRPSALREVLIEVPNVKWEDVGGLDDVKQELIEAVEWPIKNPEYFKKVGIRPPKGILLYGPPGTGKTLIAKAVANESKINFISVKGPELISKWVGESEKAVRKIFEKARQTSPAIIFFDEFDSIAQRRNSGESSRVGERVVDQILTEMDGLQAMQDVIVIAATNRPDLIDTALLRPGRFDRLILTPVPDLATRKKIFEIHTRNMPLAKDVKLDELAKKTENYVGADIEAVCREAGMIALREIIEKEEKKKEKEKKKGKEKIEVSVTEKHFEAALDKVKPSMTADLNQEYKEIGEKFRQARAKEMKESKPDYYG